MATTIPQTLNSLDYDPTPGERKVFDLLKRLPDQTTWVWYEVTIGERNRRPDFTLLDIQRGVMIIEVKDWDENVILNVSSKSFRIQYGGRIATDSANPARKCEIYRRDLNEAMQLKDTLCDDRDRLLVPVNYLVAFPNLTKEAFEKKGLQEVMSVENILFKDDLSIGVITNKIEALLPCLPANFNNQQLTAIKQTLRPETTVENDPHVNGLLKTVEKVSHEEMEREFAVDVIQEQIAKSLGEGPRLLRGFAGSGKTLILLMRAKLLLSNAIAKKEKKRILILCWNISLANYLRQAFLKIRIPYDGAVLDHLNVQPSSNQASIEIIHFIGWARDIVRQYSYKRFPSAEDPNFFEEVTKLLSLISLPVIDKYDAIFIDEAQDFAPEWISYLFENMIAEAEPRTRNLIISADDAQRIYQHQGKQGFAGSHYNIPLQGRSTVLRRVYRNSARVWMFAGFFLGNIGHYYQEDDGEANSQIWFAPKRGFDPLLIHSPKVENQIEETVRIISKIRGDGFSLRNILVLYAKQKILSQGDHSQVFPLIPLLLKAFKAHSIDYDWISENSEAKSQFDWSENTVKVSTVHSAKGLDAPVVIIVGAEGFWDLDDNDPEKLMYVALTRAREYLCVLYTETTPIVAKLQNAMKEYKSRYHQILKIEAHSSKQVTF
jgi:superfamily I DNA and RNA helicase